MSGHASAEQMREIEARESKLDLSKSPVDDMVALALLFIEPAHREIEAAELLEAAIARDPGNGPARIWLAYVLLHSMMDSAALARASDVLRPLVGGGQYAGAANMLLAEVSEEQGAALTDRIRLLELSVQQEPGWVSNRQDLAWAYSEAGRQAEAAEQLRVALDAVSPTDPSWPTAQREYEESITGRTADAAANRLLADLANLQ